MPFLMIVEAVAQAKHVCQRGRVTHCHTIQMDLMGNKLLRRDKKKSDTNTSNTSFTYL